MEKDTEEVSQPRAHKAGELLAEAIVEMVHLMYQNKTASHFYSGLMRALVVEVGKRDRPPEVKR